MTIWVCGEVLVDLIPDANNPGSKERVGVIGGGPENTAIALARLGHQVEFIDGISTDKWGVLAKQELDDDGVGTRFCKFSDKPTCQAIVSLNENGGASYEFVIDGTATFDFSRDWLPDAYKFKPVALHIGTLVTVVEPAASVLFDWALEVSELAPVIFDPNIRPAVISDRDKYREHVEKWVTISSVVKVSDDDLNWLYPDEDHVEVAKRWIEGGVAVVVITKGAEGLVGVTSKGVVSVPGLKVQVVDTIGAGDTVGAVITEAVKTVGLDELHSAALLVTLEKAARAAAFTCTKKGAQPPTLKELKDINAIY
jgi:fructokinase